jgi:PAS domain S-box-containing protein
MKLVKGITMSSMIQELEFDQQQRARLLNIFSIVCQAMAYTHSQNVIHLDLKPDNVMVGTFGEVHVMDWGLARLLDGSGEPNQIRSPAFSKNDGTSANSNRVHGTLHYMAPEQARAEPVSRATDVFCLGAILCEILTGERLYAKNNSIEVWKQAKKADLESEFARMDKSNADSSLVRLAKRCLQADPADRPTDASEIAFEMASYSESALEQVESDMTRFFELSLDLFCIAGFDGFFRRINSNFSRVLGFTDHELLSRPFLDFVHEEDRRKTIDVMGKLLEGEPVVRFRNRYLTAAGETIMFEWTSKSIPNENLIFAVARQIE